MRKLTELPTALIGAERWQLFLESVCCIPFVEVSYSQCLKKVAICHSDTHNNKL